MSSHSASEYNTNAKATKPKKQKIQPVLDKRTRRPTRKNHLQQNQNPLPENIPITQADELIVYRSFELQVTKDIIQVPITLCKTNKMLKYTWTRVGETILQLRVINNQLDELSIEAKMKMQQSNSKQNGKGEQKCEIKGEKAECKNKKKPENSNQQISEQDEEDPQIIFLVWGKVCWIGNYEVNSKTIKQSPKILNFQTYFQIVKLKTKEVNSDIFIVLNIKKKIQCVSDYNGLINQGNTCYMNSYLQMLNHITQFKNLVFQATIQDQNKFPATLQILFHKLDNQQKPVSAQQLVKSFGWTKKQVNIQQDAQQFSCIFYEALEMKLQQACKNPNHISMKQMFQGKLLHVIECISVIMYLFQADYRSENIEPFFNVPLNISRSLEQSLDDYVAEQQLSGDNLYNTDQYGPQQATKSVKFLYLPPILMIQLKRFQFNYYTERNEKIMHRFEYPNTIDFSKWQVASEGSNNYQLYAVLVHEGIKAQSGHYYAFVKIKDRWFRFNDQQVSSASKQQVFDYNFGGQIDLVQFDGRQFKVFNRKTVSSSTAYMLVYVKSEMKQQLLNSEPIYPEWLKQHQIVKQQQRQQQRNRKNFYHNVQAIYWQTHLKGSVANYLGLIPKNLQELDGQFVGKIIKNQKVDNWVKPYNQKGLGAYVYLTSMQKIQYETLINLQHRKSNFQEVMRDPSCPINIIYFPLIISPDSFLFVVKMASPEIKTNDQGEHEFQFQIKFHEVIEVSRNDRNSNLLDKLRIMYSEQNFQVRYFYQQKKELTQIKEDNTLVKGPSVQRNVLSIVIVEKIHQQLKQQFVNPTVNWYNDLKNYIEILIKSEDGKYEFQVEMDQNKQVQSLREYIFQQKIKDDGGCLSPENIVLKAKPKKTAKNFMEVAGAKTIRDLIKNCDKQNIIIFSFSNLKAGQRISQVQVKFMYRFKDFSFSQIFHVILDRNSENQSFNIYQKIVDHEEVNKYRRSQKMSGIRIFLFGKDKNIINDIVYENGHVHGKGQIAQVLQKQKGSHLVVESFDSEKIQENMCPILLHHRSQTDEKIGIPKYLQFDRSIKLTQVYQTILQSIKNEIYEWQDKKIKINPMKIHLYAYSKDYNKGIYLADKQSLIQMQLQEKKKKIQPKQFSEVDGKKLSQQQQNGNIQQQVNKIEEEEPEQVKFQQKIPEQVIIDQSQEQKNKNNTQVNNKEYLNETDNMMTIKPNNSRKNSKTENRIKPWEKTIQNAFPKARFVKIAVHHLYITKAHTSMKINV